MTIDPIGAIPQQPQRQDSLTDQLNDLYRAAVRLGLYDAADYIVRSPRGTAKKLGEKED